MNIRKEKMIACVLMIGLAGSLPAATIFSENFDSLSTGGLNGQNSWTADAGVDVTAGGLNYSSGAININGGANHVQSSIVSSGLTPIAQRAFAGQSSDVWFSYTFNVDNVGNNNDRFWFFVSDDPSINAGDTLAFGDRNTSGSNLNGSYRVNTSEQITGNETLTEDVTYFLVGRLSKDGVNGGVGDYDLIEFWLNPNSTTLGASTLTVDRDGNATGGIDTFGLTVLDSAPTLLWDNLRIGTEQTDVLDFYTETVVPEPSSMALLGVGGMLIYFMRSKRKTAL